MERSRVCCDHGPGFARGKIVEADFQAPQNIFNWFLRGGLWSRLLRQKHRSWRARLEADASCFGRHLQNTTSYHLLALLESAMILLLSPNVAFQDLTLLTGDRSCQVPAAYPLP